MEGYPRNTADDLACSQVADGIIVADESLVDAAATWDDSEVLSTVRGCYLHTFTKTAVGNDIWVILLLIHQP